MQHCSNQLCIFYQSGECTLDEIHLNAAGICQSSILVDFDKLELDWKRKKLLYEINIARKLLHDDES